MKTVKFFEFIARTSRFITLSIIDFGFFVIAFPNSYACVLVIAEQVTVEININKWSENRKHKKRTQPATIFFDEL